MHVCACGCGRPACRLGASRRIWDELEGGVGLTLRPAASRCCGHHAIVPRRQHESLRDGGALETVAAPCSRRVRSPVMLKRAVWCVPIAAVLLSACATSEPRPRSQWPAYPPPVPGGGVYSTSSPTPPPPPLPAFVRLTILDATIRVSKIDGSKWDGLPGEKVSPTVIAGLARALGASNPYTAVIGVLGSVSFGVTERPEPFGFADLLSNQGNQRLTLNADRDTLTPIWQGPPSWSHVPLGPNTRIRISLWDKDLVNHDPIGVAELNAEHLAAALHARQVYQVRVAEQDNGQMLFIGISVMAE